MQRTKLYAELVAVSIGWWLSGAVMAQAPKGSGTDQQFLRQAASDGLAEVQLGTMASTQAVSLEMQQFGRRMVTDHTKANQELMALAQAKHIGVSQDIDNRIKRLPRSWRNCKGRVLTTRICSTWSKTMRRLYSSSRRQPARAKMPM